MTEDGLKSFIRVYFARDESGTRLPNYLMESDGNEKIGYVLIESRDPILKIYKGSMTVLIPMSRVDFVDMNL